MHPCIKCLGEKGRGSTDTINDLLRTIHEFLNSFPHPPTSPPPQSSATSAIGLPDNIPFQPESGGLHDLQELVSTLEAATDDESSRRGRRKSDSYRTHSEFLPLPGDHEHVLEGAGAAPDHSHEKTKDAGDHSTTQHETGGATGEQQHRNQQNHVNMMSGATNNNGFGSAGTNSEHRTPRTDYFYKTSTVGSSGMGSTTLGGGGGGGGGSGPPPFGTTNSSEQRQLNLAGSSSGGTLPTLGSPIQTDFSHRTLLPVATTSSGALRGGGPSSAGDLQRGGGLCHPRRAGGGGRRHPTETAFNLDASLPVFLPDGNQLFGKSVFDQLPSAPGPANTTAQRTALLNALVTGSADNHNTGGGFEAGFEVKHGFMKNGGNAASASCTGPKQQGGGVSSGWGGASAVDHLQCGGGDHGTPAGTAGGMTVFQQHGGASSQGGLITTGERQIQQLLSVAGHLPGGAPGAAGGQSQQRSQHQLLTQPSISGNVVDFNLLNFRQDIPGGQALLVQHQQPRGSGGQQGGGSAPHQHMAAANNFQLTPPPGGATTAQQSLLQHATHSTPPLQHHAGALSHSHSGGQLQHHSPLQHTAHSAVSYQQSSPLLYHPAQHQFSAQYHTPHYSTPNGASPILQHQHHMTPPQTPAQQFIYQGGGHQQHPMVATSHGVVPFPPDGHGRFSASPPYGHHGMEQHGGGGAGATGTTRGGAAIAQERLFQQLQGILGGTTNQGGGPPNSTHGGTHTPVDPELAKILSTLLSAGGAPAGQQQSGGGQGQQHQHQQQGGNGGGPALGGAPLLPPPLPASTSSEGRGQQHSQNNGTAYLNSAGLSMPSASHSLQTPPPLPPMPPNGGDTLSTQDSGTGSRAMHLDAVDKSKLHYGADAGRGTSTSTTQFIFIRDTVTVTTSFTRLNTATTRGPLLRRMRTQF